VESEERLDEVMAKVHRRIAQPVVRNLRLEAQDLPLLADSMTPARLPDLFAGAPLSIALRATHLTSGAITLHGQTPAGRPWTQEVPILPSTGLAAGAIWARAHLRDLEDRYATGQDEQARLERCIVAVSLQHCVLSRFTAFIAVDRSAPVNPDGSPRRVTQPVELPEGWSQADAAKPAAPMMMAKRRSVAGPVLAAAPAVMADLRSAASRSIKRAPLKEMGSNVVPPTEPIDPTAYLERVREVATQIETAGARNVRSSLDLAIARLHELIEDLRSTAGDAGLLAALARTAQELGTSLDQHSELAELGRRAAAALRQVVQDFMQQHSSKSESEASRKSHWEFWKR
jgi:Ca-activated chloride channel family protein